jgi:hypothetical protein
MSNLLESPLSGCHAFLELLFHGGPGVCAEMLPNIHNAHGCLIDILGRSLGTNAAHHIVKSMGVVVGGGFSVR